MKQAETPRYSTTIPSGPYLDALDVRVVVFSLRDERLQVLLSPCGCGSEAAIGSGAAKSGRAAKSGSWELPGSPIPSAKSLEATATECVLRLSGLREAYLEQLYTYGDTGRHPERRLVSVVYFAIIPAGAHSAQQGPEDCRAAWFPVENLPVLGMDHDEILTYALRRLRYKLEYTAVGFQLLPEQFSLSELQRTYEIILGEKLDKRNFRRRILQAGIIEETRHLRSGEGRPARLYSYRPDAVAEVKVRRLFP